MEDAQDREPHEWKLRAGSVPIAVALALAFHSCGTGHFAQRTALTMPLHELGHAITAWWCGFGAVPTLWKTLLLGESRGLVVPLCVAAFNAYLLWRSWTAQHMALFGLVLGLGVLQFVGTTSSLDTAMMAFTFGGDAGAMILGSVLVIAFFVGPSSRLRAGGLRFGLLAIGAAGLVDTFATWWVARHDTDAIPFGEIEGVGLSDPSKLVEDHGWPVERLVDRYVLVGATCLVVIAAVWAWSTWTAWRASRAT